MFSPVFFSFSRQVNKHQTIGMQSYVIMTSKNLDSATEQVGLNDILKQCLSFCTVGCLLVLLWPDNTKALHDRCIIVGSPSEKTKD